MVADVVSTAFVVELYLKAALLARGTREAEQVRTHDLQELYCMLAEPEKAALRWQMQASEATFDALLLALARVLDEERDFHAGVGSTISADVLCGLACAAQATFAQAMQ